MTSSRRPMSQSDLSSDLADNRYKIVLDLCGCTGAWSRPYAEAGYDVRVVTLPGQDVRLLQLPSERIHGILAAPPCTYFCRMRMCRGRPTDAQFREGLTIVDACLRIITMARPTWWALENPEGYLSRWLGPPAMKFQPSDFGDPWTKKTWLWGQFMPLQYRLCEPTAPWISSRTGH